MDETRKAQNKAAKVLLVSIQAPPHVPEKSINEGIGRLVPRENPAKCLGIWRPVRESNPCRRRERDANHCNSMELRGMDSTLPHLKDSRERILDS
jgi:hypothetical protein